jgi:hypothetical protein
MFGVLQDHHTSPAILFRSGEKTLAYEVFDNLVGGDLVDRAERAEPIELVFARVAESGRPDSERSAP